MGEDQQETAILEECLESVIDYRGKTPPKSQEGIPTITAANVKSGRIDMSTVSYVSEETYRGWTTRGFPQAGDVLITTEAPVGEVAPFPGDQTYLITRRVFAMRGKEGILDNDYLLYTCLSSVVQDELASRIRGSTVPRVLKTDILGLKIPLPPIAEQKAIAHILGTLDDKIELNRKTNETLEAMAKALFQSWFVDFDPVRAKAEGRPTGLPDEISDLFPDSFEETELGEIPRGWQVQTVAEVASAIFDGPHATPAESDTGNVFLGIKNMTGTTISLEEIRLIHDNDWEAWTRRVAPQPHDIVFTYEAALGLFALIPPKLKCCLGRRMALIRPLLENGCPHFWFHQFIAAPFQKIINERCIHGATVNRTPLTEFPDYPVLTPPLPLRAHFEGVASGLWGKIHALTDQSRTLAPLRDTLLPKLISGELRIPDAEKLLEQAGV
jgi:type I restriction enzyme S subunit